MRTNASKRNGQDRAGARELSARGSSSPSRTAALSSSLPPAFQPIAFLQQTIGNRAVSQMIQAKLTVSQPGDPLEQEADRIAERVVQGAAPSPISPASPGALQRACKACEDEDAHRSMATTSHAHASQAIVGMTDEESPFVQGVVFRKAAWAAPRGIARAAPTVMDQLARPASGGEPLPEATRQRMEAGIGYGFQRVRVHRDLEAGELSRQLGAQAFTYGSDIYFAHGAYDPAGASGSRLLAHELVHVVQQGHADHQHHDGAAPRNVGPRVTGKSTPVIHRTATWAAGAVHPVRDVAVQFLSRGPAGTTLPTLNGTILRSDADARGAVNRPTVTITQVPAAGGGSPGGPPPAPRFRARVATVPTNTGSFDETVLSPGPWSMVTTKATVGARTGLAACTGAGDSTFTAHGQPSDAGLAAANRRHEDHHAADHEAAFNTTIDPWDVLLQIARLLGANFEGPTAADAEATLHAAMGGTPEAIAARWFAACLTAGGTFHTTPAGGPVAPSNPTSNADCSTSAADFTSP